MSLRFFQSKRTNFESSFSFEDAESQAIHAGYRPISRSKKKNVFIVSSVKDY